MVGFRLLAQIDKRLRQATGRISEPFGGVSIILVGDILQLPPVGDKPLYHVASVRFNYIIYSNIFKNAYFLVFGARSAPKSK